MLTAKPITKAIKHDKEGFQHIKDLYTTAFPRQEQVALPFLIGQTKKESVKFDAFYDGDLFVGLAYTISYKDITYLWYLATCSDLRSKGYGSQIMQYLHEVHPDKRIVLNLDVQDESAADNDIRKKRKDFYLRSGYSSTGYLCIFNGNKLDVMSINGHVAPDEFVSIFKKFFGIMYFIAKPKILSAR